MDSLTQQPMQQEQPQYGQPAPVTPSKKSPYGLMSVIAGLLCVVIAIVGIIKTTNSSFFEIPVVEMVLNMDGNDATEEYDEIMDEAEEKADNLSDDELEEFEDATGMTVDEIIDKMRTPSLNSVISLAEAINELDAIETIDAEDIAVLKNVRSVLVGFGAVVMLFALLAALLKNRALSIVGLIISVPFFLAMVGFAFFVLYAIASIAHVVLVSKHKKAIKC